MADTSSTSDSSLETQSISSKEEAIAYLRAMRQLPKNEYIDHLDTERHCAAVKLVSGELDWARTYFKNLVHCANGLDDLMRYVNTDEYAIADAIVYGSLSKAAYIDYSQKRDRRQDSLQEKVDAGDHIAFIGELLKCDKSVLDSIAAGKSNHRSPCE